MAIRQTIGQLGRIRDQVRETLQPESQGGPDVAATREKREPDVEYGNLFQCSTCDVVYIDSDKHSCSNCEESVEQVRSSLACH